MALKARVFVTPRQDVLDPQGAAVRQALGALGFDEVEEVRLGRYVEVELAGDDPAAARERLTAMCEQLIANPVIEDYRIEVERR